MIQGHVKLIEKDHRKAIVRTEYDDLVVLRILDEAKVDVGDMDDGVNGAVNVVHMWA